MAPRGSGPRQSMGWTATQGGAPDYEPTPERSVSCETEEVSEAHNEALRMLVADRVEVALLGSVWHAKVSRERFDALEDGLPTCGIAICTLQFWIVELSSGGSFHLAAPLFHSACRLPVLAILN